MIVGQTVVETQAFLRRADVLLKDTERLALVSHLAQNPECGVVIPGTGGIRKLRWAAAGRGKSGGVRVIYYVCNASMPLFLLAMFAKNEKSDLSMAERCELAKLADLLRQQYCREK